MGRLHATLYLNVASCESKRHDVLVGCRPKNVADALRGRWLGSTVESSHYQAVLCSTLCFFQCSSSATLIVEIIDVSLSQAHHHGES